MTHSRSSMLTAPLPPAGYTSAEQGLVKPQIAVCVTTSEPAPVKAPPAYRSLPRTASASTSLFMPAPNGRQFVPSHIATRSRLMVADPVEVNTPPATMAPPYEVRALTVLLKPEPRADQSVPFHD